jgi:hypothetical protein
MVKKSRRRLDRPEQLGLQTPNHSPRKMKELRYLTLGQPFLVSQLENDSQWNRKMCHFRSDETLQLRLRRAR